MKARLDRRGFLKALGAGACIAATGLTRWASSGAASPPGKAKARPHIILAMADDQGYGDMGYTGHPVIKTPTFDAMAAAGLQFDRFYAACPVCSPTRGSVMTGRHPNRFGCFKWGYSLRPQEITVAESLQAAGYVTAHFGKWHLGTVYKNSPVNPGASGFDEWLSAANFYDNDEVLSREGTAVQKDGESSMLAVNGAIEFLRKHAEGDKPMFAVVWFGSPHDPHKAAEKYKKMYADQPAKLANYYGEITGMDAAMGKLRETLDELGIRENTILWYCSDNGGHRAVSRTGGRAAKGSIYEGGLRVPAILEWPARVTRHAVTAVPCNTYDIYPTLMDLIGRTMPDDRPIDGVSLAGLLDGTMKARPRPVGFWDFAARGRGQLSRADLGKLMALQKAGKEITDPGLLRADAGRITKQYPADKFPGHAAWLDWPWKLHRIEKGSGVKWELYHLADDPMETKDVRDANADRAKKLRADLEAWLTSVVRSLNGKDYTARDMG